MFEKEFVERLKELYQAGKTYEEIADITGIARSNVACTINGSRPPKNLTVDALLKAFPEATINLHGDNVRINAPQNAGNVVGVNNGSVSSSGNFQIWAMDKILAADELTDEEKIKMMKVLKK